MRPNTVGMVAPRADHDLGFSQAVEDLFLQALSPKFCSEILASLQASARLMRCASCTSIWRSVAMICSGLTLRPLGILGSSGPADPLNQPGPKTPSQVTCSSLTGPGPKSRSGHKLPEIPRSTTPEVIFI